MRLLLAALVVAFLSVTTFACGDSSKVTDSTPTISRDNTSTKSTSTTAILGTAPPGHYLKNDGDEDYDDAPNYRHGNRDARIFLTTYGHLASPAETRAVRKLIRNYYTAAAAGDGASDCALLDTALATGLVPEQSGSSNAGAHNTCATAMSQLLAQQHQRLVADDIPSMIVPAVYLKGNFGLAVLGFRRTPESEIVITREGHAWKIDALFDSEMP
jgi:hypothetical protein